MKNKDIKNFKYTLELIIKYFFKNCKIKCSNIFFLFLIFLIINIYFLKKLTKIKKNQKNLKISNLEGSYYFCFKFLKLKLNFLILIYLYQIL